jgi:DnaA family protein
MLFSPQIPLKLEPTRESRFEDFVAGPNAPVLESLKGILQEPDKLLFISGPKGTGKTHLLNAACLAAREQGMTAFYAGLRSMPKGSHQLLEGLESVDLVCIDDVHHIVGNASWEESLFHCLNRIRSKQGRIVLTSRERLSTLSFLLPDLMSRLQWGLRMQLDSLEEPDKVRVLDSYALSLGIELPGEVADYLIRHSSRNLGSLLLKVERLQLAAFTSKRRITVPLAREVLRVNNDD